MNEIKKLLMTGGVLRYRPPHGFYVVMGGKTQQVSQAEAKAAVKTGLVRPNGIDQHGVYLFAANLSAINAMPALQRHPQALPPRPGAAPHALRDLPTLRSAAGAAHPAAVSVGQGKEGGRVPEGTGGLDAARAQRGADQKTGEAGCVGCGRFGGGGSAGKGQGVTQC